MNDLLYDFLAKLPRNNLINLMELALDEMQSCNGTPIDHCILHAIGAKQNDKKWKLPSAQEARQTTQSGLPIN